MLDPLVFVFTVLEIQACISMIDIWSILISINFSQCSHCFVKYFFANFFFFFALINQVVVFQTVNFCFD